MKLADLDLSKQYNYADYVLWQFKERVELLRGRPFQVEPVTYLQHQRIVSRLNGLFWSFLKDKRCEVFPAPVDVRLFGNKPNNEQVDTVLQPDLIVVCDPSKLDKRGCIGAPNLVIEVLSPGNRQLEMHGKYELYEEAGVKEYWLVNYTDKTVLVYLLNEAGRFIGLQPLTTAQTLTPNLFPELHINLEELFAE